jgi:hypothetical protein
MYPEVLVVTIAEIYQFLTVVDLLLQLARVEDSTEHTSTFIKLYLNRI